jgi:hypothetical protein
MLTELQDSSSTRKELNNKTIFIADIATSQKIQDLVYHNSATG